MFSSDSVTNLEHRSIDPFLVSRCIAHFGTHFQSSLGKVTVVSPYAIDSPCFSGVFHVPHFSALSPFMISTTTTLMSTYEATIPRTSYLLPHQRLLSLTYWPFYTARQQSWYYQHAHRSCHPHTRLPSWSTNSSSSSFFTRSLSQSTSQWVSTQRNQHSTIHA